MSIFTVTLLYLTLQNYAGVNLVDLPDSSEPESVKQNETQRRYMNYKLSSRKPALITKHWVFRQSFITSKPYEDEKDSNIKIKMMNLVQQTVHDTNKRVQSIQFIKDNYREVPPYKIGYVESLIKKSKEVMNEIFNVAVRHRDSWRALEQLKIYELIVHTNVDTSNLLRQLVEIQIQYLNTTTPGQRKF